MANKLNREEGLGRLTYSSIKSSNQHYIATYFIKKDIEEAAGKYSKGKLLDIGCGNKPYSILFKGKVDQYTGCDIIQSSNNLVDFICPANDLCFDDNSFDTVFSSQVIEHVEDHAGMLKESFRVLKPGGYAIYTAPFSWELHEEPYDFFRFSKYGLGEIFRKQGFDIVLIKSNGGKWAAIFQLFLNVLLSVQKYGTIRGKIIKWVFVKSGLIRLYNLCSIWIDKKYFDDGLTLNYIVIACKPT
jgi:SAM-dependent methyltransferase